MRIDNQEWHDPDGDNWNDLNYGQGSGRFASGAWWLIPVILVVLAIYSIWG